LNLVSALSFEEITVEDTIGFWKEQKTPKLRYGS
jgi:hypothetical protein